ncbi:asparagine-linked glycosylation protein [Blyttiomyces sp. JEL0837]|nr:asparagine-linked glycosylation protein [Blyttiomyces sp. JEL0837]
MEGAGSVGIWGYSMAYDLSDSFVSSNSATSQTTSDSNIADKLSPGGKDARHILQTIARAKRHANRKMNFYILEPQPPLVARNLMLLHLFFEEEEDISLLERAQRFLEVYGNCYLRQKTYEYIKKTAGDLIKLVADGNGILSPLCDFKQLRFRERDDLEVVFNFWRQEKKVYDIDKLWDFRLRRFYGVRYDTRAEAIDWDYHMKLRDKACLILTNTQQFLLSLTITILFSIQASIIHKTEFLRWRTHGLAYEVRDSAYDRPNRTTASIDYLKDDGVSVSKWGYFNDIVTGPFISFGIDSENQELLKTANDAHKHTSQEVAEYNIEALIKETSESFKDFQELCDSVKIIFLPGDTTLSFTRLQRSNVKFDRVFISNSLAHVTERIGPLVTTSSEVLVETAKFMLELKADQMEAFCQKSIEFAEKGGLKVQTCVGSSGKKQSSFKDQEILNSFVDMWTALSLLAGLVVLFAITIFLWKRQVAAWKSKQFQQLGLSSAKGPVIGFFHPFCDGGGGGERVLWTAIEGIQKESADAVCVIYAWDKVGSNEKVFAKVKTQFNIAFSEDRVKFLKLKSWQWLEAKRYKRLTLIGQSLGAVLTVWEALQLLIPDIFCETVGFAFPYPLVRRVFNVPVVAYVHYPTISSDMLKVVQSGTASFNNNEAYTRSSLLKNAKTGYYLIFAWFYSIVGASADVVMANSTWTYGHLVDIWQVPKKTRIVYPPCDTSAFNQFPLTGRERTILSVAQFRPEKAHFLQLQALDLLLKKHPEFASGPKKVRLVLLGGCRHEDDQKIVDGIRKQAKELGLEDHIEFVINASYDELKARLRSSSIGIHTMTNEHFGIGIVEYMASGLITVAHNSAGPKMDIVVDYEGGKTGYLATTAEEYAEALSQALTLSETAATEMRKRARKHVTEKFPAERFHTDFVGALKLVKEFKLRK